MTAGGQPQYVPAPWIYYPLLKPSADNPLTRNLVQIKTEFANSIDTVGRDPEIKKKILLTTGECITHRNATIIHHT